ncbi:MAG: ABC transporter permease, partial [Pseudomonadota bacterium]
ASEADVAALRDQLGLNKPIIVQYGLYLERIVQGDLGKSLRTGRPVLNELRDVVPATLELALAAFTLIIVGGLSLGSLAALRRGNWVDSAVRVLSTLAISAPTFWIGLILVWIFFGWLGWLPGNGRLDEAYADVPKATGLFVLDGLLAGRLDMALNAAAHLLLPAFTLALSSTGAAARLVRASLLDVLEEDYVRRARAAGLSEREVLTRYALPNALIPFVTTAGLYLADLLAGAVITEIIFGWPGVGSYTLAAISGLDFPAIMGFTLMAALVYSLANIAVDALYLWLDPRALKARP